MQIGQRLYWFWNLLIDSQFYIFKLMEKCNNARAMGLVILFCSEANVLPVWGRDKCLGEISMGGAGLMNRTNINLTKST